MKTTTRLLAVPALLIMAGAQSLFAQLNVPSDGSDGALNITSNTVIDLSHAVTGIWSNNNTANTGKGVYDPVKWAVVFKYSSINIASNVTVAFSNHPTHAPVVWLVQSNITINGNLNLNGKLGSTAYPDYLTPTEPAPGGFRGGAGGPAGTGAGYGPGGGATSSDGASYVGTYGNPQIQPIIGGSGTKGEAGAGLSGNSGGGAILIVAAGTVLMSGSITANGITREYDYFYHHYLSSSGGAIKIIANQVLGDGSISADRTRVEANNISAQLNINPNTTAVPPGTTPVIWPPDTAPAVKVVSVNGLTTPADPLAGVLTSSDLTTQTNDPVDIILETKNFPPSGAVSLRVIPKYGNYFNVNASFVSGVFTQSLWKATTAMPQGFFVLQAHATSP